MTETPWWYKMAAATEATHSLSVWVSPEAPINEYGLLHLVIRHISDLASLSG